MEARPKVALFCTNFLPYSQSFVFEELRAHRRYQAEVFAWRRFFPERFPYQPVHLANPAYIVTRHSPRFVRRFRDRPFELVHAHFGPGGCYALPYARRFDLPLVVTFHGYDVPLITSRARWWPLHWPYALQVRGLLERMTLGLCASQELYDMLRALGVPGARLAVHRLGVDLSAFQSGPRDPARAQVTMIGRFVEKKGFSYGIRAFARARELATGRPANLTIVGSGALEGALRREVQRLGLSDAVTWTGALDRAAIATLLGRTDVLLAPSVVARNGDRESGLIVVKEAGACEAVAIGTRHGGIPEIIDHERTGYLVDEQDVEAMAQHLARIIRQPALREALGRAARSKMLEEYELQRRVARLEAHYDAARESHARARPRPG